MEAMQGPLPFLVVVLHYGDPELTRGLLEQLLEGGTPPGDLLVVDNDPAPGGGPALLRDLPGVGYFSPGENLGFGGGMNRGLERALDRGYAAAALLNNDLRIDPASLQEMARVLGAEPDVGVVGALLHARSLEDPPTQTGNYLHPWTALLGHLPVPPEETIQDCDWVSGAALMLRLDPFRELGGFHEEFFLYCEELELSARWRRHGWRTVLCPRARGIHEDPGEGAGTAVPRFLQWRNRWLLVRRCFPWYRRPVTHLLTLVFVLRDLLGRAMRGRWRELFSPLMGTLYGALGWYGKAGVERVRRLSEPAP